MRPLTLLAAYVLLVFLGGALAAPWVHAGAQILAQWIPAFEPVAHMPFHRHLSRTLIVLAVAGLWPLGRALGFGSWNELGLRGWATGRRELWTGAWIGLGSMTLAAVGVLWGGTRVWAPGPPLEWMGHLLGAILAAALVAVLEELLFRGVVFRALRRAHAWTTAAAVSSAVYACAHFLHPPTATGGVTWRSGFETMGAMGAGMLDAGRWMPGGVVLFVAGWILALGYERTGRLWFSIGLHAGWVFWLRFFGSATSRDPGGTNAFWGTSRLYDGWLSCILMTAVLVAVTWWLPRTATDDRPIDDQPRPDRPRKKLA